MAVITSNSVSTKIMNAFIKEHPELSSSLTRRIKHVFCSILGGCRSIWSKIFDSRLIDRQIILNQYGKLEDPTQISVLSCLNSRSDMSDSIMSCFSNDKRVSFVNKYINDQAHVPLSFDLSKPIVIPLVLHHPVLKNHIVGFYVDPATCTIEFFDSKGLSIRDRGHSEIRKMNGETLLDIANQIYEICKKDGNVWTFKENTQRMQKDSHNCGIYVRDYFERRAGGESWKSIQDKPLIFSEANGSKRLKIINSILPPSEDSPPQNPPDDKGGVIPLEDD